MVTNASKFELELLEQGSIKLSQLVGDLSTIGNDATVIQAKAGDLINLQFIDVASAVFSIRGQDLVIVTQGHGTFVIEDVINSQNVVTNINVLVGLQNNERAKLTLMTINGELNLYRSYVPALAIINSEKPIEDLDFIISAPYISPSRDTFGNVGHEETLSAVGSRILQSSIESNLLSTQTVKTRAKGEIQLSDEFSSSNILGDDTAVSQGILVSPDIIIPEQEFNILVEDTVATIVNVENIIEDVENTIEDARPVLTAENLEISRSVGDGISDMEWLRGDNLRIRWYDAAADGYLGDNNAPGLDITRVTFDVSVLNALVGSDGIVDAQETSPGSGIWEYQVEIITEPSSPGSLLSQVRAQAYSDAETGNVSDVVAINRIVLFEESNVAEGTAADDIFVMADNTINYSNIIDGGNGNDVLDYRGSLATQTINLESGEVAPDGLGLNDLFINIEEIWVASKYEIDIDNINDSVSWSVGEESTIANIDITGDGTYDVQVRYFNVLLDALEQQALII